MRIFVIDLIDLPKETPKVKIKVKECLLLESLFRGFQKRIETDKKKFTRFFIREWEMLLTQR
jgi:hypothetical protein